jgi:hypothetical protein
MTTFYLVVWQPLNSGVKYLTGSTYSHSWYLGQRFDTVAAAREAAADSGARGWYLERVTREDIDPEEPG